MKIPEHIFRQYDVRGLVGSEITNELAYLIGRAYAQMAVKAGKNQISIGRDCRESSPELASNLAKGLNDEGIDAVLIGECPTPLMYWSLFNREVGGGIQVTGSHNPSDMNGFKICMGKDSLHGEQIQELKQIILKINGQVADVTPRGKTSEVKIHQDYIKDIVDNCRPYLGKRKLKIVVDAGNGVGGLIGCQALKDLGHEIIELFCEPDGTFPNHHPDPTVPENLKDLQDKVLETKADFGIGWDGDGDRIGLVDEQGQVIYGDMLLLIYAREILKEIPDAKIIADVKCSSLLFNDIKKRGGTAIMWKTGHSLIKSKLKEVGGALAGEMSGHIFFKHRFYGFDCASYCSARIAEIVSNTDLPVSALLADLPKVFNTPELRMDCDDQTKFKIIEAARPLFADFTVDTTDGLRIEFPDGWGLVRASNTQPILVMRFESSNPENLKKYQTLVTERLATIKG